MRGWAATIFRAFIVCLIVVAVAVFISECFRRRVERDAATDAKATFSALPNRIEAE